MRRTAGATDKTQRTRRKQTDAEKEQWKETLKAKKQKTQQEEKEEAERSRPANTYTFFLSRSTIRQRSNDNDGNNNTGISDSICVDGVANDGENQDGGEEEDDDAQPDSVEQSEDLLDCSRGTSRVESFHKDLARSPRKFVFLVEEMQFLDDIVNSGLEISILALRACICYRHSSY